mgnify:CR=1 FL=1
MRKQLLYLISFSAVVLFSFPVSSQQVNPCGTNEMLEIEIEKHPEIKDLRNNFSINIPPIIVLKIHYLHLVCLQNKIRLKCFVLLLISVDTNR